MTDLRVSAYEPTTERTSARRQSATPTVQRLKSSLRNTASGRHRRLCRIAVAALIALIAALRLYKWTSFGGSAQPVDFNSSMDTVSYSDANCTGRITHRWDYGLLYFVYGEKYSTELESFAKQTVNSAKRFKKLNPEIKIGVWTNFQACSTQSNLISLVRSSKDMSFMRGSG